MHRMRTTVTVIAGLAATIVAASAHQTPERVVPVHQEPRHRMVFEAGPTRILHLQIHPGDTSLWHSHDEPILYVSFGATTKTRTQNLGAEWTAPVNVFPAAPPSRVLSATAYAKQPLTHRIENVGETLFELVAVTNSTRGDETRTSREAGFTAAAELTNGWFRAYRFSLAPRESADHTHTAPTVVVQTSSGAGIGTGRRVFGFNGQTSWSYFDAGEPHTLRNTGTTALELVEVEVRQPRP